MTTKIGREEFERAYAERSGVTVEWLHERGQEAVPCDCSWEGCQGWSMERVIRCHGCGAVLVAGHQIVRSPFDVMLAWVKTRVPGESEYAHACSKRCRALVSQRVYIQSWERMKSCRADQVERFWLKDGLTQTVKFNGRTPPQRHDYPELPDEPAEGDGSTGDVNAEYVQVSDPSLLK